MPSARRRRAATQVETRAATPAGRASPRRVRKRSVDDNDKKTHSLLIDAFKLLPTGKSEGKKDLADFEAADTFFLNEWVRRAAATVVYVTYEFAPQAPFPTGLQQVAAVYTALRDLGVLMKTQYGRTDGDAGVGAAASQPWRRGRAMDRGAEVRRAQPDSFARAGAPGLREGARACAAARASCCGAVRE